MADFVLRCRGIPYSITKVEIEKFFDTSTLATNTEDCVQITYNEEGRPSGECFVVMADENSYYNALRKNNEYLKARYIEVFESDWNDMNRALKKGAINKLYYGGSEAPIVKMRGLPYTVTDKEIEDFFTGLNIDSMKVQRKENGEATGEAYVKFSSQDEATLALEKHMEKLGRRYIEIFKGSQKEMKVEAPLASQKAKSTRPGGDRRDRYMGGPQEHKVFMRGLPFAASQGDVIKFFAPLMPRHIEIIMGDDGRPSGTAYAFFHSHEDAVLAMEKDKEHMDTRYVDLFLESSAEHPEILDVIEEDPVMQAQRLIAQAHGLGTPQPQVQSEQESVGLTADQIISQARGMVTAQANYFPEQGAFAGHPGPFPGAQPPDLYQYPGAQPPDPYQYPGAQPPIAYQYPGVQPPVPDQSPPPPPPPPMGQPPGPPVRKRLMVGAVRAVKATPTDNYDNRQKRHKTDYSHGGPTSIPPAAFKPGYRPTINPDKPVMLPHLLTKQDQPSGFVPPFPPKPPGAMPGKPPVGREAVNMMSGKDGGVPGYNETSGYGEYAQPNSGYSDVYSGYPGYQTSGSYPYSEQFQYYG